MDSSIGVGRSVDASLEQAVERVTAALDRAGIAPVAAEARQRLQRVCEAI